MIAELLSDCRKCCAEDSDEYTSKIIYSGGVLEVYMWKLVFYPEVVNFIEDEKDKFNFLQLKFNMHLQPCYPDYREFSDDEEEDRVIKWDFDSPCSQCGKDINVYYRICREPFGRWPSGLDHLWTYKCESCSYYVHLDCATSRNEPFMSIFLSAAGLVPCSRMKSGFLSSRGRGVKQKGGSNARKTTMTCGKDVEGASSMIDQTLVGQFTSFSDAYGSPSPFTLEEILRDIKRQIYEGKLVLVGDDGKPLKPSRLTRDDPSSA
uniref:Selenoprotein F n=1 Tax=Tanacetum cinerariifolium TaxID=118510 RepID=A0A6L2MZ09_TANCI|nr:selenoprotein F [Tanacetum cinerariifolium]